MPQSDGKRLLAWLLIPPLAMGVLMLLVALVAVAQQPRLSYLLRWGLGGLLVLALPAVLAAWWQQRRWLQAIERLAGQCRLLQQGKFELVGNHPAHWPLSDLAGQLVEVGIELQRRQEQQAAATTKQQRQLCRQVVEKLSRAVAREIQQPLAGITGFVDMALRRPELDEQLRNYLNLIETEARRSREALERIVRYLDEGEQATELVEVNTLIAETVQAHSESLGAEAIDVHLNLAREPLRVEGDPARLRFVLSVLVQNAREAMAPGGGKLELGSRHADNRVVIYVRDSGRGIEENRQALLFTPFFTDKGSRRGAGLSLCLAERVVRNLGGEMDFWSRPGQGSIFFVYLPALTTAAGTSSAPSGS